MPTRNSCLARGVAPGGTSAIAYTVPEGHCAIFKSIGQFNPYPGTWSTSLTLRSSDQQARYRFATEATINEQQLNWAGWVVGNEGDEIIVSPAGADIQYWVSGALLPAPEP